MLTYIFVQCADLHACYSMLSFCYQEHHFPTHEHQQHIQRITHMSIDALLVLVEQYKEAAQLIETAQAEQEALKA